MWIYLFLGMLALLALMYLARSFTSARPRDIASALRTFAATLSGLGGLGFLAAGRIGLAMLFLTATFLTLYRLRQAKRPADPLDDGEKPAEGRTSEIRTRLLHLHMDKSSGDVDGEVSEGPLAGRRLSSLALGEWFDLLRLARLEDMESVALVEAALDRFHPDWRQFADESDQRRAETGDARNDDDMSDEKALAILGLEPGATADDIRAAHRRLMAGLHPDRGGSTWLASQINRAREHLMRHMP